MAKICVVIDWYRFSITINSYLLISIGCRLVANWRNWHINITSLYAVIGNIFHFNALNIHRDNTLFFLFNAPSTAIHFPLSTQKFVLILASRPHISRDWTLTKNRKVWSLKTLYPKWKTLKCRHGPILQTSRNWLNGCIVPSQKNSGKGTRPNISIGWHRCRSIGHRFFPIPLNVGPDIIGTEWNGIGNGSQFFIGPINKGHQK